MATVSGQTTRARSIVTIDGYVSRGRAPPDSVPRDHAMLQDFAAYLEQRLKCVNMLMLRRIFADFLNEHENTLVPMMQYGCTIITMYPVLSTSFQRRREAALLLAKPKHHLDTRGCVFLYLQQRAATRNMALLKNLFLEFVYKRETSLMAFVERGCQVISVIPFELPQMTQLPPPPAPQEYPCVMENAVEQLQVASESVAKTNTKKRKRKTAPKPLTPVASTPVVADEVAPLVTQKKTKGKQKQAGSRVQQTPSDTRAGAEVSTKRRRTTSKNASVAPASSPVKLAPKRARQSKETTKPPQQTASVAATERDSVGTETSAPATVSKPKRNKKIKTTTTSTAVPESVGSDVTKVSKTSKRGKKSKATQDAVSEATTEVVKPAVPQALPPATRSCRKSNTSKVSMQALVSAVVSDSDQPAATETSTPTPKRGRKSKTCTLSLQDEVSVATATTAPAKPNRDRKAKTNPAQLQEAASVPQLVESVVKDALTTGAKSPSKHVRMTRTSTAVRQDAANVESTMTIAFPTPKRVRKPKTTKTSFQDAESVAAAPPAKSATIEATKATRKRGRPSKISIVSAQDTSPATIRELVEPVGTEPAKPSPKRVRKPRTGSASPRKNAISVAATAAVESVVIQVVSPKSTTKRRDKSKVATVSASVPTRIPEEPAMTNTAKSTPKRGRKVKSIAASLQDTAAATTEMGDAVSVSATEPIELKITTSVTAVATPEMVSAVVTDAQPAAISTPKRGKESKTQTAVAITTSDTVKSTVKRGRTPETSTAQGAVPTTTTKAVTAESLLPTAKSTPKRGKKPLARTLPQQEEATTTVTEVVQSVLNDLVSRVSGEFSLPTRHRKRKSDVEILTSSEGSKEKSRKRLKSANEKPAKRGKPVMSEEMCRSQRELARKMESFEAQTPWQAAYSNVSPPFDEEKHPALAKTFRTFWLRHSRAVWERNFWGPMSRKLNPAEFNKRNNRQLRAKTAFESLIVSAHEELGAAFFVTLDSQKPRHPGWWYRGPVVALFALQQIKGEEAVWSYVMNEARNRFPDCNLPLPLAASNSGAMRVRHKRESASMWVGNHQQTAGILEEMAALLNAQEEVGQATMEAGSGGNGFGRRVDVCSSEE